MSNSTSNKGLSDLIRAAEEARGEENVGALLKAAKDLDSNQSNLSNLANVAAQKPKTSSIRPASPRKSQSKTNRPTPPLSPKITTDELKNKLYKDIVDFLKSDILNKNPANIMSELRKNEPAYRNVGLDDFRKIFNKEYRKAKQSVEPPEKKGRRPSKKSFKKPIEEKEELGNENIQNINELHRKIQTILNIRSDHPIIKQSTKLYQDIFKNLYLFYKNGKHLSQKKLLELFNKANEAKRVFKKSKNIENFTLYNNKLKRELLQDMRPKTQKQPRPRTEGQKKKYEPKVNCKDGEFRNYTNRCIKDNGDAANRIYKLYHYYKTGVIPSKLNRTQITEFKDMAKKFSYKENSDEKSIKEQIVDYYDKNQNLLKQIEENLPQRQQQRQEQQKQKTKQTPCPKYIRHITTNKCVQLTPALQKKFDDVSELQDDYLWEKY